MVAAVIAVLAAVVVPTGRFMMKREREAELRLALRLMRNAIDEHKRLADQGMLQVQLGTEGKVAGAMWAFDGETAAAMNWTPPLYGAVYALENDSPNVFAAGAFGLAAITEVRPAVAVPPGPGLADPTSIRVGPVPSTGRTAISFVLGRECRVRLRVFDVQGRVEAELVDGILGSGIQQVIWSGKGLRGKSPAGSYFVRLEAEGRSQVRQVILAR